MRYAEIIVLNRDLSTVTRLLSDLQSVQMIRRNTADSSWNAARLKQLQDAAAKLDGLASSLGIQTGDTAEIQDNSPHEEALKAAGRLTAQLEESASPLKEIESAADQRVQALEKSRAEFEAFKDLDFDFSRINTVSYLFFKYGTIPSSRLEELELQAGIKSVIIPIMSSPEEKGQKPVTTGRIPLLAASSRKGRFALETALRGCAFQEITVPEQLQGIPAEIVAGIDRELEEAKKQRFLIREEIRILVENNRTALTLTRNILQHNINLLHTMQGFKHTRYTSTIRFWIPAQRTAQLSGELDRATNGKAALEIKKPHDLPEAFLKKHPVPVLLRNNRLLKPFEFLIANYGYPEYGEIEPTPIVAFGFVTMFGIMFGDIGQGGVLILAGLLMALSHSLKKGIRQAGILIAAAGMSAAFFGWVYGSVFCDPHLVPPLWTEPLANPEDILILFGTTIAFGVFWINTGMILNLINRIRVRDWKGAFLDKTGLVGNIFYLGTLSLAVAAGLFKIKIPPTLILLFIGLPLLILFLREPIHALFCRKPLFKQSFFTFFVEGLVELIDTVSYFLGNTVSFVRVGAFALAHGGLSLACMELYQLVGGGIGGIAILIPGNLLIIVLEGMVVTIQTMRLEYYEFFSKFYSGNGTPFTPFRLSDSKRD